MMVKEGVHWVGCAMIEGQGMGKVGFGGRDIMRRRVGEGVVDGKKECWVGNERESRCRRWER